MTSVRTSLLTSLNTHDTNAAGGPNRAVSIKYTERLEEAKIDPSVGSVGDSYDNAMAETINGLYKAEVIEHEGPWQGKKDVEFATLDWVHWFNTERRFGPTGYIAPAQAERNFYDSLNTVTLAAE